MEPAGAVCSFDRATGRMTVHSNSNMLNFAAWVISGTLKIAPELIEFHPMYTGGSFGSKHFTAKVIALAGSMSMLTGRPVKFMEDRADNLLANSSQAPDRHYEAALAIDADGKFLSVKYDVIDDYGAYFCFAVAGNTNAMAQSTGPYDMGSCETAVKAVLTNKNQQGVFRGAGSEVSNWVLERLVDAAAAELGIDGIELRRRNLIQPDQFPYKIPTGNVYDSGDYPAVLEKALAHADLDYWRAEQERGREQGRYIGIGFAQAQQRSTYASTEFWFHNPGPYVGMSTTPESVRLSVGPTGGVTATMFSPMWGNSPETVVAQAVAEELQIDPADVAITYDSTAHGLPSAGPGGSRQTVMLSGAVKGAAQKVREKAFAIAAHQLEANPEDMELSGGMVRVRGVADDTRAMSLADIGMKAYWYKADLPEGMESGLEGSFTYDHPYTTLPNDDRTDLGVFYPMMGHAVHIVVVEVDVDTGQISFLRYLAVHDVGTIVNPRSLRGQIRGGIAMGIGVTLMEQIRHDADGHALSGSFEEYLMPLAGDVPNVEVLHVETPSPFTAYGVKGGGEGGRMVAPAAITSAIEDALAPVRRAGRRPADHRRADRELGQRMKLDHAALIISDPAAARAFYVGVLGLEEIARPVTFTFPGLWLAIGDRQLHLIGEAEPGRAREDPPGFPDGRGADGLREPLRTARRRSLRQCWTASARAAARSPAARAHAATACSRPTSSTRTATSSS